MHRQQGEVLQHAVRPADSHVLATEDSLVGELCKILTTIMRYASSFSNSAAVTIHPQETDSGLRKFNSSSRQLPPTGESLPPQGKSSSRQLPPTVESLPPQGRSSSRQLPPQRKRKKQGMCQQI